MAEELGHPPVILLDTRPIGVPILAITSHAVAEQISKPSKLFPYSVPKSNTLDELTDMIGHNSIIRIQVCDSQGTPY
jgi:hypothetical protein